MAHSTVVIITYARTSTESCCQSVLKGAPLGEWYGTKSQEPLVLALRIQAISEHFAEQLKPMLRGTVEAIVNKVTGTTKPFRSQLHQAHVPTFSASI